MSIIPKTLKNAVFSLFLLGATVTALALWSIPTPSVKNLPQTEKDDWQVLVSKNENDMEFVKKLHEQHLWKQEVDELEIDDEDEKTVSKNNTSKTSKKGSNLTKISKNNAESENDSNIPQGDWQLFGIISEGKTQYALLRGEDEKIERYKKGDLLAQNIELFNISDDFVEIKRAEQKEVKDLYAKTLEELKEESIAKKENTGKNTQKPVAPKKKRLTAMEEKKRIEEMRRARRAKAKAAKERGN